MYSTTEYLYLALIFVAVTGITLGLGVLVFRPRVPLFRSQQEHAAPESVTANGNVWQARIVRLVEPLARLALPEGGLDYSSFRVHLMSAGFRNAAAPVIFFSAKLASTLLFPAAFMAAVSVLTDPLANDVMLAGVIMFAALGFFFPNSVLRVMINHRQRELFEAFPDAIDLLVVCVEAGLGLDAAIARTSKEMRLRSQVLADELHLVTLELRVGASREQALRNLALRTGLDDVAALVTMLVQADRFGTNVADALRVHADSLRIRRQMRAEEAAAKLPVKLVFPLVLCVFPALMIVLAGPPFISIFRNLFPVISGH